MKSLVRELVLECKGTFEEERYFHIYYSSTRYAAERRQIENKIDRMASILQKMKGKQIRIPETYKKYFDPIYHHEGQKDECIICEESRQIASLVAE